MSRFTTLQIEKQITDALIAAGNSEEVAHTAAIEGANHYEKHSGATALTALAWAKTFIKSSRKIKGRLKRSKKRRM
ncbi:hypothetical protein [Pantoea coffeiphila]|uniref:Uncharacterized protein n=1 Tax=Pantoea coffeiphila TaxID=1465635 RepID=A0A2S9I887_9GAMM|nr:hypothetical protein [Pantoea coffeiphila]PRD14008.1 hypothetical protein CQW29_18570 [Pantoea coffeiphila]